MFKVLITNFLGKILLGHQRETDFEEGRAEHFAPIFHSTFFARLATMLIRPANGLKLNYLFILKVELIKKNFKRQISV